ncbi:MAG: S-layer homology domain-containing protein [Clostridia bacterium]|nr:S-layer homology domain-containing protein [Clostridia bacterium]
MKKIITLLCVISMLVGLITMPVSACDACKVLCDENYETVSSPGYTPNQPDFVDDSVISTVDSSDYVYYGLGNKVAELRSDTTRYHGINTQFEKSENIQSGSYNGAGYTVDLSFDIQLSEFGNKMRVLADGTSGFDVANNVMGIEINADKEIIYYGRNTTSVLEKKSLDTEKLDENHFYRVRFVFYINNDEGTPVNYCDVYIDGYKVFENKEYAQNKKQRFICALSVAPSVDADGVVTIGMVDNLNVMSYGADKKSDIDAKTQKDSLLANIRTAGKVLKNEELSETAKTVLTAAIQTAIDKYVSDDSTAFYEATTALKAAVIEAEKSTETPEGPSEPDIPDVPDVPEEPDDEFSYIVRNNFETESKNPFTSADMTIVEDNTAFINKAWKITGKINLLSDVFKETNILNSSEDPDGSDCVVEFDIKFDNLCELSSNFAITQLYDQTPDGTQIACLTFQKGDVNKMDGGGKTETTIGTNIFEDDIWYRVRIVQHMVNKDGTFPQDMSLYIDSEPVMEHFARRSRTSTKAKLFNQLKLTGLGDGVVAYMDNLAIYKTTYSKTGEPLDLGKNMKIVRKMQTFLDNAVVGDEFGEYDSEDYNTVKTAYETAISEIPQFANQADADNKAEELNALFNSVKPNQGKIWVESVKYSADNLKDTNSINADIAVSTSRLAEETNNVLALSVLYKNSEAYPGGEMLSVSCDTAILTKKDSKTLKTTLDLSAQPERDALFVKTYVLTGENRAAELNVDNSFVGNINNNTSQADKLYDKNADVFKKLLSDDTIYFSFSAKTEAKDRILIFVTKEENNTGADLTEIDKNNASDKLVYFNIADVNESGEVNLAFNPKSEGKYRVVAYSAKKGQIYDSLCTYLNSASTTQILTDLKNGTVKIAEINDKLDINDSLFKNCADKGISLNDITREIFENNGNANVYDFKTEYVKYMNLLYNIKTAVNLDTVEKTLNDFDLKNTNDAYTWNSICEYVFNNKNSVNSPDSLSLLLNYKPIINLPVVMPNYGQSTGSGGGGGGGYATTATVENPLTESQTPYEKNSSIFSDISSVPWAEEAIIFLAKNNIVNGKAEGIFAPDDKITREEFAKIVVNTFRTAADSVVPPFADADQNSWYYPYVSKIYSAGIAKGISDNIFGIGMNISREDAIVILYRAGNLSGASYSAKAEYIPFEDSCSDYAQEAVEAFAKSGIITGTGNNMLNAGRTLTRAEAAKMVYGLYKFINQSTAN